MPFTYHPDPMGGTEVYVEALAERLRSHGVESIVVAPGGEDLATERQGLRVRRYALGPEVNDPRELSGEGDAAAAANFERVLDEERPDLVHLHAQTRGVSLRCLRAARRRRIPVVYTYHTPTATCQRGTLLRWGAAVCEGVMHARDCTACALHGKGLPRPAATLLAALPEAVSALPGRAGLRGGTWTAVRMRELVALRQRCARAFLAEADHVVAVCEWVRVVLLRNGVPADKITLSRQGLCQDDAKAESGKLKAESSEQKAEISAFNFQCSASSEANVFRVAFLGRLDPTKGVDVLVRAVRAAADLRIAVDIFGVAQGAAGGHYARSLRELAAGDARITFQAPLPASEVVARLREYDLLAAPSQWLETGPLVVLEAFAAGVPVLGSRLGGIAELVRDGVDGVLVEPASIAAWTAALRTLAAEPERRARLRAGIRPPRTMAAAAAEMAALYRRLLGGATL
jgi:glycosyltransferase involved in cell wall biosynthesis